jgi:hypothetical protein
MLGMEGLDFSNKHLIFHLNSSAKVCGSFGTKDSTAHAMSRLERGFVTEKFKPFIRTAQNVYLHFSLSFLSVQAVPQFLLHIFLLSPFDIA